MAPRDVLKLPAAAPVVLPLTGPGRARAAVRWPSDPAADVVRTDGGWWGPWPILRRQLGDGSTDGAAVALPAAHASPMFGERPDGAAWLAHAGCDLLVWADTEATARAAVGALARVVADPDGPVDGAGIRRAVLAAVLGSPAVRDVEMIGDDLFLRG